MKQYILTLAFGLILSFSWSQHRKIDYDIIVNNEPSSTVFKRNMENSIEVTGRDSKRITIQVRNARIHKLSNGYSLIPDENAELVYITFLYRKNKKTYTLGIMEFKVQ